MKLPGWALSTRDRVTREFAGGEAFGPASTRRPCENHERIPINLDEDEAQYLLLALQDDIRRYHLRLLEFTSLTGRDPDFISRDILSTKKELEKRLQNWLEVNRDSL